ncbi:MAG: hypothetical protein GTN38_04195 [Candidatus Aenigmarchaeota archaeon]|nr:hypothetical protein [Candidatus Aenigmarchaeota archaeon]NIP40863.1 hypothetical protein [Candidatus Aenigmarchaeota archaeon]NIQ17977.1 hypothetical protein [Candidatus Aenigmarchaeota archaeon]NIS73566.1 hypothetical protein [Candidatus Aenigmarchaeota archaeon]
MKTILWIGVGAILLGAFLFGGYGLSVFLSAEDIPLPIKAGSLAFLAGFIIIILYLFIDRIKDIKEGKI